VRDAVAKTETGSLKNMRRPASRSRLAAAIAGGAVFCLALAAAGLADFPSLAQTNNAVKVASAGIASDIGFFIAHKKGYFRAEGLDVTLTTMANSPQMIGPLGMGQ
jgi:NitT/TauT family transport system substrate-binding protein